MAVSNNTSFKIFDQQSPVTKAAVQEKPTEKESDVLDKFLNNPEPLEKTEIQEKDTLKDFISNTLIQWTTVSSALVNMVSAPIRLFTDDNPIKNIVNKISMFFTKLHLGSYSVAGLISAFEQKNPFLIFSFFTEGIAAFLGLDKIYLFRGIATGIDGAVAGIKDKYGKSEFSSYSESFHDQMKAVKDSFGEICKRISKDPMYLLKLDGSDIAIFASLIAAFGGVVGMLVHEKLGSAIRDIAGAFGDYGVFSLDNPTAKKSGFAYLAGSILDFSGRIFNEGIASLIGITHIDSFKRLKDAFLEAAIACDRVGQYFFLKYNQKTEKELETEHTLQVIQERKKAANLHKYQIAA